MPVAVRRLLDDLRADRRTRTAAAVAVAVNAILIAAYIWSRGGQTTHVRIEARGTTYSVFVDGRKQIESRIDSRLSGGVVITLDDTYDVPSLPSPRGIDRVRVTSLDTGAVLLDDSFDRGASDAWNVRSDGLTDEGGVLGSHGTGTIGATGKDWGDYAVDVTYRNVRASVIVVRSNADQSGVATTFRGLWWNDDLGQTLAIAPGRPGDLAPGQKVLLDRGQSMRSIAAMLLRPYPSILLLLLAGAAMTFVLGLLPQRRLDGAREYISAIAPWWGLVAVVYLTLAMVLRTNFVERDHMPYVPDSLAYIFQAKIFAAGRITAPPPPVRGAFDFFDPAPFVLRSESWATQFPFGHPLVLVPGIWLRAPWLVPPLLAAASVAMTGVIGRRMYSWRTGVLAAVLLATSPFFLMNAEDFMSHNTAIFYLLASLLFITTGERRPAMYGAIAGLSFGLFFNTRPLSAAALAPAFGVLLVACARRREERRAGLVRLAGFAAGGLVMFGAYLLYNYATTGSALRTGYQATGVTFFQTPGFAPGAAQPGGVTQALGAGGSHDTAIGIANERVQLALLALVIDGWPTYIGLAFVLLPFILGTRKLRDWWLLACAVSVTGVWVLFESTGVMYGPRYWFEALPFLILLTARGADRAAETIAAAVERLRAPQPDRIGAPFAATVTSYAFVAALIGGSVWGWTLGRRPGWRADFVPPAQGATCCVLGLDDRIAKLAAEQRLSNALVLVQPCATFVCYGSVFWRNNPTLDGDIVYAKDGEDVRQQLIAAYPGRSVYLATYDPPTLRPFDPNAPPAPPARPRRPTPPVSTSTPTP